MRAQGLYSSQVTDWRRLRDGGALTGTTPVGKVPKLTADQKENARLRAKLDRAEWRLARTEVALDGSVSVTGPRCDGATWPHLGFG